MWYTNNMTNQTFICNSCNKPKPANQYWIRDGKRRKQCKKCMYAISHKRYDYTKERARKLKNKFNLNPEQYNTILQEQKGICAICTNPPESQKRERNRGVLMVDHNHSTGINRGLLCRRCNGGIGLFKDNISLLIKAINYLTKHEKLMQQTQTSQQSI